jgi:diguanylate cyclase (GGDEF)-like protein
MTALVDTWKSYGQLLTRLHPSITHIVFAGADAVPLWSSEAGAAELLRGTLSSLLTSSRRRNNDVDGLTGAGEPAEMHYGFRIRGGLGELLGLVGIAACGESEQHRDLSSVHSLIRPALDCLQSELAAWAAVVDGSEALGQIPELALEHLSGKLAVILLPERNLTLCRTRDGQSREAESAVLAQMHRHLMTRAQLHGCTLVANKLLLDGASTALPYKAISTPIRDALRRVVGVLAVFRVETDGDFQLRDAEALELLARKAAQIIRASIDGATGLLTSSAFVAQTTAKLAATACASTNALLHLDIDQLSVINENHGMQVGDEVIQAVATQLQRRERDGALVARIGGDCFALFVPGVGIEPAARIAEELRGAAIKLSGARGDKPLQVSLSIGVSRMGERDRRLDQAMAAAELASRTAKERGRNRVEIFFGDMAKSVGHRAALSIAAQVSTALATDAFELLAQPILPLSSALADPHFEVLLRMRAADGTRIGLDKVFGAAGCQDLHRHIDRWVIERSLERIASCRDLLSQHPAKFSVNLSAASLADEEFWRMLEERVRKTRLEPGALSFEFPEEAARAHIDMIVPHMRRLREQGVSFALDNFGRDGGSLSSLSSLPVSCIKIDGSISRDLVDNPKSQSMVGAIIGLARTFGLETVAGHIETDAIRARAADLGVDYGQGFFIGKPLALDDVIRDLPLYSCFATATGLIDPAMGRAAVFGN